MADLAARQWRDYRAREPGMCFADPDLVLDLQRAYEVQDAVAALRVGAGDRVIGYKVGCTGPYVTAQFGMAGPIRGHLYASEVRRNGATLAAADFANLAIEGEMALRIGADGEIATAFPVIELHNFIFRAPCKTLSELVANNGLNAGIVLPEEEWPVSSSRLAGGARLVVQIGNRHFEGSDLWPLPGGATASLDWLRQQLSRSGLVLVPGQIVLSGTPLGLYPVTAGDHVTVSAGDLPPVRCSIA